MSLELSLAASEICRNGSRVVIGDAEKHTILFKMVVGGPLQWMITTSYVSQTSFFKNVGVALQTTSTFLCRMDCRFSVVGRNVLTDVCERLRAKGVFVTASGICIRMFRAPVFSIYRCCAYQELLDNCCVTQLVCDMQWKGCVWFDTVQIPSTLEQKIESMKALQIIVLYDSY